MRVLVLVNPNASRAEEAMPQLLDWCQMHEDVHLMETAGHDDMVQTLKREGPGCDRIVIGGGDGTISDALPALLEVKKPLGIIPLGTANDLARTLGVPH